MAVLINWYITALCIYIYIYIHNFIVFYNKFVVSTLSRFVQRNLHYELERRSMTMTALADGHHFWQCCLTTLPMIMAELKWDRRGPLARSIDIPGSHNCTGVTRYKQAVRIPHIFRLTVYCRVKISRFGYQRESHGWWTGRSPCCS
jgi:hypothetical protein